MSYHSSISDAHADLEEIPLVDDPREPQLPNVVAVDGSAQIWSICLTHAEKFDKALVERWKGDMDGILIFSGLFSAIVTAFLVDSYKSLQPDPGTVTAIINANIYTLLKTSPDVNANVEGLLRVPNLPSPNNTTVYLIINAFWFLSLVFSLSCALAATLVQQWSRTYLQGTEERFVPHERMRMRTFLQLGVQTFRLTALVEAIPMLLHAALFFFFSGLLVFLFSLNTTLAAIVVVLSGAALSVYVLLTTLPVFYYQCPYKTPLTSVMSYITYAIHSCRPRRRRSGNAEHTEWHPEKQSAHLITVWEQDGGAQGAELDHTALRWTLNALTDRNDLEAFVGALPGLLQSDAGSGLTRDGGRAVQALLFGPDMLSGHVVRLLESTLPSDSLTVPTTVRRRLDERAATCLGVVALLSRACAGPTPDAPQHWAAWAITYFDPIARLTLALCEHPDPAIAVLARTAALLLAWRALVIFRTFLVDVAERAERLVNAPPAAARIRAAAELQRRLSERIYLVRALREVVSGLAGTDGSGAPLLQATDALLGGSLHACLRTVMHGAGVTEADVGIGEVATAARVDIVSAKLTLATLFMHASCVLPADAGGAETLKALAAPLGWREPCTYDVPNEALRLLLTVHHAHGMQAVMVLDADEIVKMYGAIHDPRAARADASDANGQQETHGPLRQRGMTYRKGTL